MIWKLCLLQEFIQCSPSQTEAVLRLCLNREELGGMFAPHFKVHTPFDRYVCGFTFEGFKGRQKKLPLKKKESRIFPL